MVLSYHRCYGAWVRGRTKERRRIEGLVVVDLAGTVAAEAVAAVGGIAKEAVVGRGRQRDCRG